MNRKLFLCLGFLVASTHCAPKRALVSRPVPDWDVVERLGLDAPRDLPPSQRTVFDRGWDSLRGGRLDVAYSDIEELSRKYQQSPEIRTAEGFLRLRLGEREDAERSFQAALRAEPGFGPAQSGYFLAALAAGDEERALQRLLRLESGFPQHELVDRHATTLRVNVAESRLRAARELSGESDYEAAAAAYLRALEVAPEAGALYLEAAEVELAAGLGDRAVLHALRASELEPSNTDAHRVLGEARYANEDLAGAARAFERAASLRPGDDAVRARLRAIEAEIREKTLPPEYSEIASSRRVTREQLAALVSVELKNAFDSAQLGSASVIATDISESWAREYIRRVVSVGVLEVFPNHTFQPKAFVSRIDLARTLVRALQVLAPEVYERLPVSSRISAFPDLPRENVSYGAAAASVSLGIIEPGEDGAFEPQRLVSGADAVAAVSALGLHMTP